MLCMHDRAGTLADVLKASYLRLQAGSYKEAIVAK